MNTAYLHRLQKITPTESEASLAQETVHRLAALVDDRATVEMQIVEEGISQDSLVVPGLAMRLLSQILAEMAQGNAVTVMPTQAELSTQQAADLLNVSRPFLVQLLESGEIPYHKIGTHRRVLFEDVLQYKERIKSQRRGVLEELTAQSQELELDY